MSSLVLHPHTKSQISGFMVRPGHALLIHGPSGIGKGAVASHLASQVLGVDNLETYLYAHIIRPSGNLSIGIDQIRELEHFVALKIPGTEGSKIARVVIIEDAHYLTDEAQNALLKSLEEPPGGTIIILTAISPLSLLSTIRSRVQQLPINQPTTNQVLDFFKKDHTPEKLNSVLLMSGGLPGLAHAILNSEESHPLVQAANTARQILGSDVFTRLCLVDALAKQKDQCTNVVFILEQMAQIALSRSTITANSKRWQRVLTAAYRAREDMAGNTQIKLVMDNLMLAV